MNGKAVVKVGYTTRTVEARAKELGTGIPGGLSIAYKLRVDDARQVERQIHRILNSRRVPRGPGREFFAMTAAEAIETIEKIALHISSERVNKARREELYQFEKSLGIPRPEFAAVAAAALFVITFGYQLTQISGWKFNLGGAITLAIAIYLIGKAPRPFTAFCMIVSSKPHSVSRCARRRANFSISILPRSSGNAISYGLAARTAGR